MTEAEATEVFGQAFVGTFGLSIGLFLLVMFLVIVWNMVWKGIALWKAGRNNHLGWFIIMFLINTMGILEIIYIFAVGRRKQGQVQAPQPQQPPQPPQPPQPQQPQQ